MKSYEIIAAALSEWRAVASAADLAHETFDQLDDDEVQRLAMRAYCDELRAGLRRKQDGVPVYSNVDRINPDTGKTERIYKQTALFDVDDYRTAIKSYAQRATDNARVARSLADDCQKRYGVQLPIPGFDSVAS